MATTATSPLARAAAEAAAAAAVAAVGTSPPPPSTRVVSSPSTTGRSTPPPPTITNRSASNVSSPPRLPMLECDYDLNPSYLYQAIEAREWDHAKRVFIRPNAQKETATWVTRKEVDGKLRWRLLPIHAAIIFKSPLEIVELILNEYPECAQCKDDQGMLPLHLAFRNGSEWDIMEELLTANPQAIAVKDRKGRTPINCTNASTKKQATVMELYTQIALSSERQRSVQEARSILDARVAALQESHVKTLTSLKNECQEKITDLEQCLLLKEEELQSTRADLVVSQEEIKAKEATELELSSKLGEVSVALEALSAMRAAEESVVQKKYMEREKVLTNANEELLRLVQSLLDQQTSLKVSLDKQAWEAKDKDAELEELFKSVTEHHAKAVEESGQERDMWRGLLEQSNQDAADRVATVMEKTSLLGDEPSEPTTQQVVESFVSFESSVPGLERTRPIGSSLTLEEKTVSDEKKDESVSELTG